MSFLALSASQALLLAGLVSTLVVVLFFLKLRHRRVIVGSALLWNRVLDQQLANSMMEKLRRLLSLLLTLVIALLIALAVARPDVDGRETAAGPLVLVLDTSPSMTASVGGVSRWDSAVRQARDFITRSQTTRSYMVADTAGRVRTPVTSSRQTLIDALDKMTPFPGEQHFPSLSAPGVEVYFITDGVIPVSRPPGVREISVFAPTDNVAVTAFEVRIDPTSVSGYRAFLEVTNYADRPMDVGILLSGAGDERQAWRLDMEPGDNWQDDLDLAEFRGGPLRLRIEAEGDGLTLDDTAYAYLPPPGNLRVGLVSDEAGSYLETLLRLSPEVDLRVVRPAAFREDPDVDIYIFDGFQPADAPRGPSIAFGAGPSDWMPARAGAASDLRFTTWEPGHPLMENTPVSDVVITEAGRVDPEGRTIVASADGIPLILTEETPVRRVFLTFGVGDSDFPFHLGFPVFIENALRWCSGEGLAESGGLGHIRIPMATDQVTMLDGTQAASFTESGHTVIDATQPGLYTATAEGRRVRVAANLLDRAVSDVNHTRLEGPGRLETRPRDTELWFPMLVAALLLIGLESWTYHRRVTL